MAFKTESLYGMQKKKKKSTDQLQYLLLDLHQHLTRLAFLVLEYLFSAKK